AYHQTSQERFPRRMERHKVRRRHSPQIALISHVITNTANYLLYVFRTAACRSIASAPKCRPHEMSGVRVLMAKAGGAQVTLRRSVNEGQLDVARPFRRDNEHDALGGLVPERKRPSPLLTRHPLHP